MTLRIGNVQIEIKADDQQQFVSCLLTALLAAMPTFLNQLISCLTKGGGGTGGDYKPGEEARC